MSEDNKNLNEKVDQLEAAAKKYASKDTVISIGGYEFTPAKLMIAFTLVSSALGGLYGAFEVYKDYQGMKKKIAEYVSPDLAEVYTKLDVITTQNLELQKQSEKSVQYTQDIKNDLKSDVRRLEGVVENVERSSKQASRETEVQLRDVQNELRRNSKEIDASIRTAQRETESKIQSVQREIDGKIQRALDNPLSK